MLFSADAGLPGTNETTSFLEQVKEVSLRLLDTNERLSDPQTPDQEKIGLRREKQSLQEEISRLQGMQNGT